MSAEMLPAALALADAGLPVFPLVPRGKKPRFTGSFHDATIDRGVIEAHWRRHRHDNVGCAPPAGMVVVDVDLRDGGDTELARLVAERGPLPETWTAQTGSGGLHRWFNVGDVGEIRGKLCRGVDLKHGGTGYVVMPPSIHPCGGRYWWRRSPRGRHPAAAPEWLREAVQRPTVDRWTHTVNGMNGRGEYTVQCLAARISAAREGNRNTTVFGALKDAARQGDLDVFEADLTAAAVATGLPVSEVEAILRSVRGGR